MLKNYLLTAIRSLKRNKVYTFLNVFGLALGIGCALVIYKVVRFETSFDKHQDKYASVYRVVNHSIYPDRVDKGMGTPHPLGPALKAEFPEIAHVVRTNYMNGSQLNVTSENGAVEKFLFEEGLAFTEPAFFDIFTIDWKAGNRETALQEPNTVVISESNAQKLFQLREGEEAEAIGKLVNFNNVRDFKVVGIMGDPVETTSVPFEMLFEYQGQDHQEINPYFGKGARWNSTSSNTNTYVVPGTGFDPASFNQKLLGFVEKYHGKDHAEDKNYLVQPLSDVHYDEEYSAYSETISLQFLYALGIIGIFLVVTACINFVNLSTAQASNRAREIGIRKAIGSFGHQLVIQFLAEIAMITLFALLISLAISELMFSLLKDILGMELTLDLLNSPETLLFLFVLFVVVSLLSGFYPAILLSRMNAVQALKSRITVKQAGGLPLRKGLVILQFTISQFLIIGTLIVSSQTNFFLKKDLGFNTKAIFTTYLPERDEVKMERFRQAMLSSSAIENVSFAISEPSGEAEAHSNFNYPPLGSQQDYNGNFKPVDEAYADLFELKLLAGRFVQKGDSNNVVINRQIADLMGFENEYPEALGKKLTTGWGGDKTVVGVMEDFHAYSLERGLDYILLFYQPEVFYNLSFKAAAPDRIEDARTHFEETWEIIYPEYVIDYTFYDEYLAERYENVQNITALMKLFAGISILIGCLGLYGLISFIAINKTKEIGVRKVLGASVMNILAMFSREVFILMTIAFAVTTPIAWYFLNAWLDNFAFRISIGPGFFIVAFIATMLIALVTISHKTLTSAFINPAETLKDD